MLKRVFVALSPFLIIGCSNNLTTSDSGGSNKPYPTVAYVATYDLTYPGAGKMQQKWYSNGAGKVRLEMQGASAPATITVVDFRQNSGFLLMPDQKQAMAIPMNTSPAKSYINEYTAKERGLESLGAKSIRGHACHGWKTTDNGMISETWVEDGSGILVESKTDMGAGQSLMALTNIEKNQPDPGLFDVPSDYSIQNSSTASN